MDDMISRQAALDALDKVAEMFPYRIPGKAKTYRQYNEAWSDAIDAAENALEALPSAQPVNIAKLQPNCNQIASDCISRQAAIDMLKNRWKKTRNYEGIGDDIAEECELYLKQVPPAQPETAKRIVGKSRDGMTLWYQCEMCNEPVDAQDNFCRGCGRRLTDG